MTEAKFDRVPDGHDMRKYPNAVYPSMERALSMLRETHGHRTLEEIKDSYVYYHKGSYQMKFFRELNYVVICETLKVYDDYVKEQLGDLLKESKLFIKEEPKKVWTKENSFESAAFLLKRAWALAEQSKVDSLSGQHLYDTLNGHGLIELDNSEKSEIQKKAIENTKAYLNEKKEKNFGVTLKGIMNQIGNLDKNDYDVIIECKRLGLLRQIQLWIMEDLTMEDITERIRKIIFEDDKNLENDEPNTEKFPDKEN